MEKRTLLEVSLPYLLTLFIGLAVGFAVGIKFSNGVWLNPTELLEYAWLSVKGVGGS